MQVKVLVADDHPLFRKGLVNSLNQYQDIEVVYEAKNGMEVIDWLKTNNGIDVILLDINMPKMSGLEVLKEIKLHSYHVKAIIISMHPPEAFICEVIEAGASGYLSKEENPEEIYNAIQSVVNNGFYFSEYTDRTLLNELFDKGLIPFIFPNTVLEFSYRELTIIKLISQEMTNEEIAKELHLGVRTVEGIRQELIHKVGARNAVGLILYAQKTRLI